MYKVHINNKEFQIEPREKNVINGSELSLDILSEGKGRYHVLYNHQSLSVEIVEENIEEKAFKIKVNGRIYSTSVKDKYDELLKALGMENLNQHKVNELKAPMPGLVVNISVSEGQELKKGDPVLVLEAMKMENILKAPSDAVVKKIVVSKGDKVEKNQVLVNFN